MKIKVILSQNQIHMMSYIFKTNIIMLDQNLLNIVLDTGGQTQTTHHHPEMISKIFMVLNQEDPRNQTITQRNLIGQLKLNLNMNTSLDQIENLLIKRKSKDLKMMEGMVRNQLLLSQFRITHVQILLMVLRIIKLTLLVL